MHEDMEYGMFCAGPLNLDMQAKKARTIYGDNLLIDEKTFHALYQLSANEGTAQSFESLYLNGWYEEKSQSGRDAACRALNDLMEQVNAAGHGLMSMEYAPEVGYVFQTIWPRNRPVVNMPVAVPDENNTSDAVTPKRRGRRRAALLFGTGAAEISHIGNRIFNYKAVNIKGKAVAHGADFFTVSDHFINAAANFCLCDQKTVFSKPVNFFHFTGKVAVIAVS